MAREHHGAFAAHMLIECARSRSRAARHKLWRAASTCARCAYALVSAHAACAHVPHSAPLDPCCLSIELRSTAWHLHFECLDFLSEHWLALNLSISLSRHPHVIFVPQNRASQSKGKGTPHDFCPFPLLLIGRHLWREIRSLLQVKAKTSALELGETVQ